MTYTISWCFFDNTYKVMHQNKVLKEFRFENEAQNYIRELQGNKPLKCFLCDSLDIDESYLYYDLVSGQDSEHQICFHCHVEQAEIFGRDI